MGGFVGADGGVEGEGAVGGAAVGEVDGVAGKKIVRYLIYSLWSDWDVVEWGWEGTDVPDDAVANLEDAGYGSAHGVDFAGDVAAKDGRPFLDKDAEALHMRVEGVDGDGAVADNELVGLRDGHGGVIDLEWGGDLAEPGSFVHRHFGEILL